MAGNIIELHTEVPAFCSLPSILRIPSLEITVTFSVLSISLRCSSNWPNTFASSSAGTSAKKLIEELTVLAKRGNTITKQNVNYALSLAMEQRNEVLTEIDKDFICNTIRVRNIYICAGVVFCAS